MSKMIIMNALLVDYGAIYDHYGPFRASHMKKIVTDSYFVEIYNINLCARIGFIYLSFYITVLLP